MVFLRSQNTYPQRKAAAFVSDSDPDPEADSNRGDGEGTDSGSEFELSSSSSTDDSSMSMSCHGEYDLIDIDSVHRTPRKLLPNSVHGPSAVDGESPQLVNADRGRKRPRTWNAHVVEESHPRFLAPLPIEESVAAARLRGYVPYKTMSIASNKQTRELRSIDPATYKGYVCDDAKVDTIWISPSATENFANGTAVHDFFKEWSRRSYGGMFQKPKLPLQAPAATPPPPPPSLHSPQADTAALKYYELFERQVGRRMAHALGFSLSTTDSPTGSVLTPAFDAAKHKKNGRAFTPATTAAYFAKETLVRMKRGDALIVSAPVISEKWKVHGTIDYLVRSDFVNVISPGTLLEDEILLEECTALGHRFWYVCIDAKCRKLPLAADGQHILNAEGIPGYKSQLFWYQECVRETLGGKTPRLSFLVGNGFSTTTRRERIQGSDALRRLGRISFDGYDCWVPSVAQDARLFLRDLRVNFYVMLLEYQNLHERGIIGQHAELFVVNAGKLHSFYGCREFAETQVGTNITSFLYCGKKQLTAALDDGFIDVFDRRFTKGWLRKNLSPAKFRDAESIYDALSIPPGEVMPLYLTPEIVAESGNHIPGWLDGGNFRDLFVDFETFVAEFVGDGDNAEDGAVTAVSHSTSPSSTQSQSKQDLTSDPGIFMISLLDPTSSDHPVTFVAGKMDNSSDVIFRFSEAVKKAVICEEASAQPRPVRLWHYGNFESAKWKSAQIHFRESPTVDNAAAISAMDIVGSPKAPWCDAHKIARIISFAVGNCLTRKLKDISNALDRSDSSRESESVGQHTICNGYQAAVLARRVYAECEQNNCAPASDERIKDIVRYNQNDVILLQRVLARMRAIPREKPVLMSRRRFKLKTPQFSSFAHGRRFLRPRRAGCMVRT